MEENNAQIHGQGGQPQGSDKNNTALICSICGFATIILAAIASVIFVVLDKSGYLAYYGFVLPAASLTLCAIGTARSQGNKLAKIFGIIGIVLSAIMLIIAMGILFIIILFIQACSNIEIQF